MYLQVSGQELQFEFSSSSSLVPSFFLGVGGEFEFSASSVGVHYAGSRQPSKKQKNRQVQLQESSAPTGSNGLVRALAQLTLRHEDSLNILAELSYVLYADANPDGITQSCIEHRKSTRRVHNLILKEPSW